MEKKVILSLSVIFMLFMAGLFIYYFMKDDTSRWQVAAGGILVSALPLLLLFMKHPPFNIPVILAYYVFIFCSTYLGSIAKFYLHILWWDTVLHLFKGIFMGFIALCLFKIFVKPEDRKGTSPLLLFLFSLSLAASSSVFWEVYEYFGDLYYTETMQRGGNADTMQDLLAGLGGGLAAAVYAALRQRQSNI
ncbi:membrane-spanning protein [Peribacillus sp. SCS-26]|uniref:membrane-spanning protein n=1 Tax=Paraperibacillus marinus TaxID=3115295 RepID=UPI0039061011